MQGFVPRWKDSPPWGGNIRYIQRTTHQLPGRLWFRPRHRSDDAEDEQTENMENNEKHNRIYISQGLGAEKGLLDTSGGANMAVYLLEHIWPILRLWSKSTNLHILPNSHTWSAFMSKCTQPWPWPNTQTNEKPQPISDTWHDNGIQPDEQDNTLLWRYLRQRATRRRMKIDKSKSNFPLHSSNDLNNGFPFSSMITWFGKAPTTLTTNSPEPNNETIPIHSWDLNIRWMYNTRDYPSTFQIH